MKKYYFTFGQSHAYAYGGRTFDKDCVVEIEAENKDDAREKMFEIFGAKWSFQYDKLPNMSFFPRGIMKI